MMDLYHIRTEYRQQSLSRRQCQAHPLAQFRLWLNEAMTAKVNEPTAMNLATVDADGWPQARIVLLKEVSEEHGFVFFSNYHSPKGQALAQHPVAALTFFWPELERQVRISGTVKPLPQADSDAYFQTRPYTSRIGAWASEQSQVIRSKASLLARAAALSAQYPTYVPRPPHWGGYGLHPHHIEFWQGRPSRLHDRIRYRFCDHAWLIERLSP